MDEDLRDVFKTVATVDAAAIAIVATFAGGSGSHAFNWLALLALLCLVLSIVGAVLSMLLHTVLRPREESTVAGVAATGSLIGFAVGFALLALYGATRLF